MTSHFDGHCQAIGQGTHLDALPIIEREVLLIARDPKQQQEPEQSDAETWSQVSQAYNLGELDRVSIL